MNPPLRRPRCVSHPACLTKCPARQLSQIIKWIDSIIIWDWTKIVQGNILRMKYVGSQRSLALELSWYLSPFVYFWSGIVSNWDLATGDILPPKWHLKKKCLQKLRHAEWLLSWEKIIRLKVGVRTPRCHFPKAQAFSYSFKCSPPSSWWDFRSALSSHISAK